MTMTDPVADMLTRLRNANTAMHDEVTLPSSTLKANIAEILEREGFISGWKVEDARVGKTLTLSLKYGTNRERALAVRAVLEAQRERLADACVLDLPARDEALALEDLSDVRLEGRRRQRDLVVHRRVGVAQTRQHVGDRVGHRHGCSPFWFRCPFHGQRP